MGDSRQLGNEETNQDKLYELLIQFYKKALSLPNKALATEVLKKIQNFLRHFSLGEKYPANFGVLTSQIKLLASSDESIKVFADVVILALTSAHQNPEDKRLSDAISETRVENLEEIILASLQNKQTNTSPTLRNQPAAELDKTAETSQPNQPTGPASFIPTKISTGINWAERKSLSPEAKNEEARRVTQLNIISIQHLPNEISAALAQTFKSLTSFFETTDLRFLTGSHVFALHNTREDKLTFILELGPEGLKPENKPQVKALHHRLMELKAPIEIKGPHIKDPHSLGVSFLMLAASFGEINVVRTLMDTPDLNEYSRMKSALHFACQFNQTECAKLLMQTNLTSLFDVAKPSIFEYILEHRNLELLQLLMTKNYTFTFSKVLSQLKEMDQTNPTIKFATDYYEMVASLLPTVLQNTKANSVEVALMVLMKNKAQNQFMTHTFIFTNAHINEINDFSKNYGKAFKALEITKLAISANSIVDYLINDEARKNLITLFQELPDLTIVALLPPASSGWQSGGAKVPYLQSVYSLLKQPQADLNEISTQTNIPYEILKKLQDNITSLEEVVIAINKKLAPLVIAPTPLELSQGTKLTAAATSSSHAASSSTSKPISTVYCPTYTGNQNTTFKRKKNETSGSAKASKKAKNTKDAEQPEKTVRRKKRR